MDDDEVKKKMEHFQNILRRDFYTIKQLLALGIYGSKTAAHYDIKKGKVESAFTTDRRLVVFTESLLARIELAIRSNQKMGGKDETMRNGKSGKKEGDTKPS